MNTTTAAPPTSEMVLVSITAEHIYAANTHNTKSVRGAFHSDDNPIVRALNEQYGGKWRLRQDYTAYDAQAALAPASSGLRQREMVFAKELGDWLDTWTRGETVGPVESLARLEYPFNPPPAAPRGSSGYTY